MIRELKQRRRRRRGRRLAKNEFIFYQQNSQLSRSVRYANGSKNVFKLNMQRWCSIPNGNTKNEPSSSTLLRRQRTWSFHVLVLQRTAKKCTKIKNARAQLLFCSFSVFHLPPKFCINYCYEMLLGICRPPKSISQQ